MAKKSDYEVQFLDKKRHGAGAPEEVMLLPKWDAGKWHALFAHASSHAYKAGDLVIHRGHKDRQLYFLVSGALEITLSSGDNMDWGLVAKIKPGSVIGEQSFFDSKPRSADVRAVEDSELLSLSVDAFQSFAEREPVLARDVLFALGRILSTRLRNTTARLY